MPIAAQADWRAEAHEAWRMLRRARLHRNYLAEITAEQRLNRALEEGFRDRPKQRHDR